MKKLLIALGILALAIPAYGRVLDLWVGDGTGTPDSYDQDTGDSYFEACMEVDGDLNLDGVLWLSDGTVFLPSLAFDSDAGLDSGFYYIGADNFGITVGGVYAGDWSASGLTAIGVDAPIGFAAPNAAVFTTVQGTDATFTGDFQYGQTPADLHTGYKERGDYITFVETFTTGVDATYAADFNVAGVVGAGTNTVTVRDGWSELVTGGAGGPDMESTVSFGLANYRAYTPRIESVIELAGVAGQRFSWGFYAAANEFVEIVHDTAIGANWYLQVDDTTGVETIDSGVLVTADPTKLEIQVDAAGDVTWAIDDVAMPVVGLTNQMTANAHYHRWILTDIAAAPHTVAVDYFMLEQLRQQ